jgi:hypothetical protein
MHLIDRRGGYLLRASCENFWPSPFARIEGELHRYTLFAYDTKERASAVATGVFRRRTTWRHAHPVECDFPPLHLHACDLMFFVDPEGGSARERARGVHWL